MARQKIKPGGEIEALTLAEARGLLSDAIRGLDISKSQRVRAGASFVTDAAGNADDDVYTVPAGFQFEVRRVVLDADAADGPNSAGRIVIDAAGEAVEYLRSGTRIEYGQPQYGVAIQIPGIQTWGAQQGPYLRNDEVFQIRARGLGANVRLRVTVEGILYKSDAR